MHARRTREKVRRRACGRPEEYNTGRHDGIAQPTHQHGTDRGEGVGRVELGLGLGLRFWGWVPRLGIWGEARHRAIGKQQPALRTGCEKQKRLILPKGSRNSGTMLLTPWNVTKHTSCNWAAQRKTRSEKKTQKICKRTEKKDRVRQIVGRVRITLRDASQGSLVERPL